VQPDTTRRAAADAGALSRGRQVRDHESRSRAGRPPASLFPLSGTNAWAPLHCHAHPALRFL
jgi:hypothetical protein